MLSAAGLSGGVAGSAKPKPVALSPPPTGAVKIRTPLPPPPNDAATVRMASATRGTTQKGATENSRQTSDPLTDLSQLEACLFSPLN